MNEQNPPLPGKTFSDNYPEYLKEGERWNMETANKWYQIKTIELSKEIITFNLAVLAFQAAIHNQFHIFWLLIINISSNILSIIFIFIYIFEISKTHIKKANEREKICGDARIKLLSTPIDIATNNYNERMAFSTGEMQGELKKIDYMQKAGIVFMISGIILTIIGLII